MYDEYIKRRPRFSCSVFNCVVLYGNDYRYLVMLTFFELNIRKVIKVNDKSFLIEGADFNSHIQSIEYSFIHIFYLYFQIIETISSFQWYRSSFFYIYLTSLFTTHHRKLLNAWSNSLHLLTCSLSLAYYVIHSNDHHQKKKTSPFSFFCIASTSVH
jgi:hypothetical protein